MNNTYNSEGIVLDTLDYEGFRHDMIEGLKKRIPEYSDFRSSDFGICLIELLAEQLDKLSYQREVAAEENNLVTAQLRDSVYNLCRYIGYTMYSSTPSQVKQIIEILPQSIDYTIKKGTQFRTTSDGTGNANQIFEASESLTIPKGCTGIEKDDEGNYLYELNLVHGYSVSDTWNLEEGTENLTITLNNRPVIEESLEVTVFNGVVIETWTKVNNFIDSSSDSPHFLLKILENGIATLTFGNGVSGKIPQGELTVKYRIGGGEDGNVGARTIVTMMDKPYFVVDTFNPTTPYILGKDEEDIDEAKDKAPTNLGTKWGIVSETDYGSFAKTDKSVSKSTGKARTEDRRTADVWLLLKDDVISHPEMVQETLIRIQKKYEERKMIGTNVVLHLCNRVPININVMGKVRPGYNASEIKSLLVERITSAMSTGNYDFGSEVEASDFYKILLTTEGLKSANVEVEDYILGYNEIPELGNLNINLIGGNS